MGWVNKNQWTLASSGSDRRIGKIQNGAQGNRVNPTDYDAQFGHLPTLKVKLPNGAMAPTADVPNLSFTHAFFASGTPFPGARNKAWSKLVDHVRSGPASLGESVAESHKALSMVARRATQMYHAYSALRKGNFRAFLRELSIGPYRKHKNWIRSPINQASSLWLEYSFGWKPAVKDIYDAATTLSKPVPGGQYKGSGRETYASSSAMENSINRDGEKFSCQGVCFMGAFVTVDSPNAYLVQSMGLANPIQIAWNLLPMSFLADWVFDVNTFLGALTDFVGCTVQRPYTCYFARATVTRTWTYVSGSVIVPAVVSGPVTVMRRRTGLDFPYPNFSILTNIGQSLTRAANAVSLLGQILTK